MNKENLYGYSGIRQSTTFFIKKDFETFNIKKLQVEMLPDYEKDFTLTFSYSYDSVFWSDEVSREDFPKESDLLSNCYIRINLHPKNHYTNEVKNILVVERNHITSQLTQVLKISYDNKEYTPEDLKVSVNDLDFSSVNIYPRWNFYDNNENLVNNWLKQCRSIVEMYGYYVVWFHTKPIATSHTFANNFQKEITTIKKIPIIFPNNDIPQNRHVFTDWDIQMEGDIMCHVVDSIFKQAFGEDNLPLQKDYLFLPMLNRFFRVSSVQAKNGFMGKVGWWEVFLTKFEKDETINFSQELKDLQNFDDFAVFSQVLNMEDKETIFDQNREQKQLEEAKNATDEFTNAFRDSTHFIDLKASEDFREFYNKRVEIVSVNPHQNAFPLNMYNFEAVKNREIAMNYNLSSLKSFKTLQIICNFVLQKKFTGELFSLSNNNNIYLTISIHRDKFSIFDTKTQTDKTFNFSIKENNFYQVVIGTSLVGINNTTVQYHISILKLEKGKKIQVFEDIATSTTPLFMNNENLHVNKFLFYGGKYLVNEINLYFDDKKHLTDWVKPIFVKFDN